MITSPTRKPGAVPGSIERGQVADHIESVRAVPDSGTSVTTRGTYHQQSSRIARQMDKDHFRFFCKFSILGQITVHGGNWRRHNRAGQAVAGACVTIPMSVDSGTPGTYASLKTITADMSSDRTGFVVLTLDDPIAPTTLTVSAENTYPANDYTSIKWILGTWTCVNGEITAIEQYWTGDVGSAFLWTDTAAQAAGYTGNFWKSITINSTGTLSLFGFEGATDDHAPYRLNTAGVKSVGWVKTSGKGATCTTAAAVAGTIANGFCADGHTHVVDPSDFAVASATYATTAGTAAALSSPLDHGALTGLTDYDHPQYILKTGSAAQNNMSGYIGDNQAEPKTSIAPNDRVLYGTDGAEIVFSWGATKYLAFNGIYDNFWTSGKFNVTTTGVDGISLNAGASGGVTANGTFVTINPSGNINLNPTGTVSVTGSGVSIANTSGNVGIAPTNGDVKLNPALGHVNLNPTGADNDVILNPSGAGGAIVYGSTDGVTLADWTHKGGLIGTGIVRKRVEDLNPTDVVLCIPGGAT